MKTASMLIALFVSLYMTACNTVDPNEDVLTTPKKLDVPELVTQLNSAGADFGIDLFTRTAATEEGNLMLSPLSAKVALTMLLNGSRDETYDQIHTMLGYTPDMSLADVNRAYKALARELINADPRVTLALANAVFYLENYQVKPPFLAAMRDDFGAHIQALNFGLPEALTIINRWASDNTNARIPKVLDQIQPNTVMFLMNALYFKGDWSNPFDKNKTSPSEFTLADGSKVQVPTMNGNVASVTHYTNGYRALEIPYGRKNFSMILLVPNAPLADFLREFNGSDWQELTRSLDSQTESRDEWPQNLVELPRFGFEYEKILNDQLQALGMTDAFDANRADLTGIADDDLVVSFVKQNTFVEVNEEGTEAAAVTTVGIIRTSVPTPFQVNQPFVFAIRERTTNTLLFIGQVTDPRS
jgi:serpin B